MAVLRSDLTKIAREAGPAGRRALLRTANDVLDISQQFVPVDTGELKESGLVEVIAEDEVHVGYSAGHAIFPEFGTIHQAAQPYLTPAMQQARVTFEARLKQEMAKVI
jgi:HK97 gp10 family phage protein